MIKFRELPPICLGEALFGLILGRLKIEKQYKGDHVNMENGNLFLIFRNITKIPVNHDTGNCLFIVSFKFSRLSFRANRVVSILPMLLIAGFPGFMQKMYAVNPATGYWQGMYQWRTPAHLERYKQSFVYRMMNRRAVPGSLESIELMNQDLIGFIQNRISRE